MYFAGTLHAAEDIRRKALRFSALPTGVAMRGYNGNLEFVSRSIT